jgi:hypothetical protein
LAKFLIVLSNTPRWLSVEAPPSLSNAAGTLICSSIDTIYPLAFTAPVVFLSTKSGAPLQYTRTSSGLPALFGLRTTIDPIFRVEVKGTIHRVISSVNSFFLLIHP